MGCVSFFLFSAGCKNEAKTTVVNNTMTKILNKVTQSSQQSISNLVTNWQDLKFNVGKDGSIKCKQFNIKQNLNGNMKVVNEITSSQASQIKNDLKEQLTNDVKTLAQNDPNLWQSLFGKTVDQSSITEVTNNLQSEFENTVKKESIMNVVNSFVNKQNLEIPINGLIEGDLCNFGQDMLIDIQANNILKSIQDSLLSNAVFRNITNKLETAAKTGGGGGKKGKGGKKKKKKTWLWIIVFIIFLGIAASIYRAYKGGKSQQLQISVASPPAPSSRPTLPVTSRASLRAV